MVELIPWEKREKIRLAFVTREDAPSYGKLAKEFGVSRSSIKKWGHKEEWLTQRKLHRGNVAEKAQLQIEQEQSLDIAKSVRILESLIAKMIGELDGLELRSFESGMREIRESLKTVNMLQAKPEMHPQLDEVDMEERAAILLEIKKKAPKEYEELRGLYEDEDGGGE